MTFVSNSKECIISSCCFASSLQSYYKKFWITTINDILLKFDDVDLGIRRISKKEKNVWLDVDNCFYFFIVCISSRISTELME